MAHATLTYNAASGSNTAASGAGPSTAVTGTSACHNNNTAGSTTWTLTNTPDLSGVAAGDVIWVNTASGNPHLYRISSVDDGADTVTVVETDAPAVASGSAVNYAIGGKRQTFENDTSQYDWEDWGRGWRIELDDGQSISAAITPSAGRHTSTAAADPKLEVVASASASGTPVITQTADADIFVGIEDGWISLVGIGTAFSTSRARRAWNPGVVNTCFEARSCDFDGTNSTVDGIDQSGSATAQPVTLIDCDIHDWGGDGIQHNSRGDIFVMGCKIHDNGGDGFGVGSTTGSGSSCQTFLNNVFWGNTGHDIDLANQAAFQGRMFNIIGNTFFSTTDDAIGTTAGTPLVGTVNVFNNTFVDSGGYAIGTEAADRANLFNADYNHYDGNTSGNWQNLPTGISANPPEDNSLSGDPTFTSETAGSEDFRPASGSPLINAGFPVPVGEGTTTVQPNVGALQEVAGGGGGVTAARAGLHPIEHGIAA